MARTIKGAITEKGTGQAISEALVKAYDSDIGSDDLMGEARTDAAGKYLITYKGGHWDPAPHRVTTWRPDIFIKVFLKDGSRWLQAYKSRTYEDWKLRNDLTIDVQIDRTARTVEGTVTYQGTSRPAPGLVVRAMDADELDKNDQMGEATTDNQGFYRIHYRGGHWDPSLTHRDTQWRPDIYIVVFARARDNELSRTFKSAIHKDQLLREKLVINAQVPPNEWVSQVTAFDPTVHGWPFDNDRFRVCAAPTCKGEHPGDAFRSIASFRWALCGGMSLGAARRFSRGRPVEAFSPQLKEELVRYQLDTLLPSFAWWTFLEWQARPDLPHRFALHTIGYSTEQEWPKLKGYLDQGKPRVIGLIRVGPTEDPGKVSENHQVLAIGYKLNRLTNEVELKVYDPNYHGRTSTIYFNTGLPQNQLKAIQKTPGKGSDPVRGFFLINVSHD